MRGLGLGAVPLLVLLALSQFAGAARGAQRADPGGVPSPPRSAPPEERVEEDRRDEPARAPAPAVRREPSLALLLLLKDAATRWHRE